MVSIANTSLFNYMVGFPEAYREYSLTEEAIALNQSDLNGSQIFNKTFIQFWLNMDNTLKRIA